MRKAEREIYEKVIDYLKKRKNISLILVYVSSQFSIEILGISLNKIEIGSCTRYNEIFDLITKFINKNHLPVQMRFVNVNDDGGGDSFLGNGRFVIRTNSAKPGKRVCMTPAKVAGRLACRRLRKNSSISHGGRRGFYGRTAGRVSYKSKTSSNLRDNIKSRRTGRRLK